MTNKWKCILYANGVINITIGLFFYWIHIKYIYFISNLSGSSDFEEDDKLYDSSYFTLGNLLLLIGLFGIFGVVNKNGL